MGERVEVNAILGGQENGEFGSAVSFSDARILFFPVKSAKGIFAYATCPFAIKRFMSDCKIIGIKDFEQSKTDWLSGEKSYVISCESAVVFKGKKAVLDEYVFSVEENEDFKKFSEIIMANLPQMQLLDSDFLSRTILIGDDEFLYFVTNSTEVVTRIKIDNASGTAGDGALFTQENLPPECILYSLLFFTDSKISQKGGGNSMSAQCVKQKFNSLFSDDIFQIGGDMTLGKGLFCKKMWRGGEMNNEKYE